MISQKHVAVLAMGALLGVVIDGIGIAEPTFVAVFAQSVQNASSNLSSNNTITQSNRNSETAQPLTNLIIEHAGGGFTSLQEDNDNKTWITTGNWDLVSDPSNTNQSNSSVVGFNATIEMRGTDNAGGHEHKVSEFKLISSSIGSSEDGSEIIFNGTGSIETDVGLYSDVPISIKIYDQAPAIVSIDTQSNEISPQWIPDGGTVSVLIDERIDDHFGNTPVYGNVRRE